MIEHTRIDASRATTRAADLWVAAGGGWDDIVSTLRSEGFGVIDCIRAAVDVLQVPLDEAKRLVHNTDAMADEMDALDSFHDLAEQAVADAVSAGG